MKHFLYPSNLVSIFLSNALDIMQSPQLLQSLDTKVPRHYFLANNKPIVSMQHYDLWVGQALVGRLFSPSQLMQKHEALVTYEVLQRAIKK